MFASFSIVSRLLHAGITNGGTSTATVHKTIDAVDQINWRKISFRCNWRKLLAVSHASDTTDFLIELERMEDKGLVETGAAGRGTIHSLPNSLKISSERGCRLTDKEKSMVPKQLRDADESVHITQCFRPRS